MQQRFGVLGSVVWVIDGTKTGSQPLFLDITPNDKFETVQLGQTPFGGSKITLPVTITGGPTFGHPFTIKVKRPSDPTATKLAITIEKLNLGGGDFINTTFDANLDNEKDGVFSASVTSTKKKTVVLGLSLTPGITFH